MLDENALISGARILQIIRSLAGHVDLRDAIHAVSEELKSVVDHDHFDAALFTECGDRTVVYETGLKTSWGSENGLNSVSPIRELLSGEVDFMITENAMVDERMCQSWINSGPIFEFGIKSRVHARIEIGGNLIGALSLSSKKPGLYADPHVEAARVIADVVGPYFYALQQSEIARRAEVERAKERADALGFRRGARRLTEQLERERQRIGMDLHDQTLAELTRVIRITDAEDLSPREALKVIREQLTNSTGELRNIIENAKPSLLHLFGLVEAIEGFLDRSVSDSDLSWSIDVTPAASKVIDALPEDRVLALYRIIQEALNNVIRHSGASKVKITFESKDGEITTRITDNGGGMPDIDQKTQGGIKNMHTRSSLIGGAMTISTSGAESGTDVFIRIPANDQVGEVLA